MRKLSTVLMIVSLFLLTGLSAIGSDVRPTVPGASDGWRTANPGLPILPFGDDSGGSH
jgi:hypothetical protein